MSTILSSVSKKMSVLGFPAGIGSKFRTIVGEDLLNVNTMQSKPFIAPKESFGYGDFFNIRD
jgi:hypothetical protein